MITEANRSIRSQVPILRGYKGRAVYWLHPHWLFFCLLIPIYLVVPYFDFEAIGATNFTYNEPYLWGFFILLLIPMGATVGMAACARVTPVSIPYSFSPGFLKRLRLSFWILFAFSVFGYVTWFAPVIINPAIAIKIFIEGTLNVRGEVKTIGGVTTFTQFGVPFIICAVLLFNSKDGATRSERIALWTFMSMVMARVILWSERLALMEVLVCALIVFERFSYQSTKRRLLYKYGFLIGIVGVIFVFGLFEYFRSWYFYSADGGSYIAFVLNRLIGYYATAINNGIGFLEVNNDWPFYNGQYLFEFAYRLPFVGVTDATKGYVAYGEFLDNYVNSEFTNQTAVFRIIADFGYLAGATLLFIYGIVGGAFYGLFRKNSLLGIIFFPLLSLSFYEIYRFPYFSDPRAVYIILGCLAFYFFIRVQYRKEVRANEL